MELLKDSEPGCDTPEFPSHLRPDDHFHGWVEQYADGQRQQNVTRFLNFCQTPVLAEFAGRIGT